MKTRILALATVLALTAAVASAEEVVRVFDWTDEVNEAAAENVTVEPDGSLTVRGTDGEATTTTVLVIEEPGVGGPAYAVRGRVCYEGVMGQGYLQMTSRFPDGGAYFSRTLSDSGALAALEGSSGWRDFVIPFMLERESGRPSKLELDVVLPGPGTVRLAHVELVQHASQADVLSVPGQWLSAGTATLIGTWGGAILGIMGGLAGMLSGTFRKQRAAQCLLLVALAAAICLLVLGLVALIAGQAYSYVPLLLGGMGSAVVTTVIFMLRRRISQQELRQMQAQDA